MRIRGIAFLAAGLMTAALALPASGQEQSAQDLVGTWKRDDGKMIRLDWDAAAGELTGTFLDLPENDVTHLKYGVKLRLRREGDKVIGKAIWRDTNPKTKGFPPSPDYWDADALWELEVVAPGKLKGRTESMSFGWGKVTDKQWDQHELTRLAVVTMGGSGKAPEKVEAAQPIDAPALAGTWKTSTGAIVNFKPQDSGFQVERIAGTGAYPTALKLANEGNVLKGSATWDGGAETKVELRLTSKGRLEGRAESIEGAERGWAPLAFERLPRIDDAPASGGAEPGPIAPPAPGELTALDYKRDDGLYLRLTPQGGGKYTGELVSKTKFVNARLDLVQGADGKLTGTAVFKIDGAAVETKWELSPQPDGTLDARSEWFDWDASAKTSPVRGMSARKFKPLKRVG